MESLNRLDDCISLYKLNFFMKPGGKISTCPLVITSEIYKGRVILPKALVLKDECFGKNYSRKSCYILLTCVLYCTGFYGTIACVCRTSENCKSLVLQDKCNIEIFLSPGNTVLSTICLSIRMVHFYQLTRLSIYYLLSADQV